MSSLTVNDILEELLDENNRILNELLFAHKCIIKSLEFKEFIDSIDKEFVDQLNPKLKRKYEELSRGFNHLIDQKWANISDNSPNESKTVIMTMSKTNDHPIERDSDYRTTNENNFIDEEVYINEESLELEIIRVSKTKNKPKHICDQCGSSYEFQEVFDLHIQYCRLELQSVSTESQSEYNWCDIEEEEGEIEMISEKLIHENMATLYKCNNYEGDDHEEPLAEEVIVEEPVTEMPSVRTKNFSHNPMTTSSAKAVSEQQLSHTSDDFNLSSKLSARKKSKTTSRVNKKLFPFKCGFNGCNAVFCKRKTMFAHRKLHQWNCEFPGCNFQTQYQYKMNYHLNSHSKCRPFQCDYCDKNYKYRRDLTEHMKRQHLDQCPNDPILVCDWNECHFRTKSMKALNAHKCSHTLPFECQICKHRFSTKNNMKKHLISKHKNNQ